MCCPRCLPWSFPSFRLGLFFNCEGLEDEDQQMDGERLAEDAKEQIERFHFSLCSQYLDSGFTTLTAQPTFCLGLC